MKSFNYVFAFIIVLYATACSKKEEHKMEIKKSADTVETVLIKKLQPARSIALPGDLRPWEVTNIQAKVKGYVRTVTTDRGSFVKKGQVLATLEAPELKAQLAEALAKVEDVKSKQIASRVTYTRMLQTSKTQGAIAANELDVARSKMMVDSMQVLSATASYNAVKEMVNYLNITAPFEGTVIERTISPGELVGPDRAKPLFILENSQTLRLTMGIPEIYSGQLKDAQAITFKVTALPEKIFNARLSRSSHSLDYSIRSMMVEFDVNNKEHLLKAGMYAEVTLPVERTTPTLFVPATAVVSSTERVFVIQILDGKAKWIDVKVGTQANGLTEIFGPIEEGQPVVAKATEELRDGNEVVAKAAREEVAVN
jgi:membrane fusion protein (multidrug efflux system)